MKNLILSLAGIGGAMSLALSPFGAACAQTDMAPAVAATHGDWTLRQREDWMKHRLEKARDDGSLTRSAFNSARLEMRDMGHEESRMRHDAHGELTDNQTAELDARLDTIAAKIAWAHESDRTHPW